MTPKTEIVRHHSEIPPIADVCGQIRALSSRDDFQEANVVVATMKAPTIPHYHREATEFYFVLSGKGRLIVGRNVYEITNWMLVIIPSNTVHYTIPSLRTEILAFSVPAWREEDQFPLEGTTDAIAGYSSFQEKAELIEEILRREGLEFQEGMSRKEREDLDIERQGFVLGARLNLMSIPELREALRIS